MAIVKKEATFKSTCPEDINIYYAIWQDDAVKPIGVIQLTHGWGEHINRYEPMIHFLCKNGYICAGQDHIGHGRTAGVAKIGIYPYQAANYMVEDMYELYKIVHGLYPELPYMLYGHSLGSMMARTYLTQHGADLTAAIICGTVIMPGFAYKADELLYAVAKFFSPNFKKICKAYDKKFEKKPPREKAPDEKPQGMDWVMACWLSFDQDNIQKYYVDPYIGVAVDPSVLNMLPAVFNAAKTDWQETFPKELPVFFMSGMEDICGLFSVQPRLCHLKRKAIGGNSKLKIYHHAMHEVHNEARIADEVFHDILNFFNQYNPNK